MLYAILGLILLASCSGQSGSDRNCVVQGTPTQLTERVVLAQCGDGSICVGACGGTQDSNNPTTTNDNDTTDSNNTTKNNFPPPT
jgi:hypothetical protein